MDEADRFYGRFIDDMLALTKGTEAEAEEFVKWLNTLWPGLKFTYKWSNKEITFLDVRLVMGEVWKHTGTSHQPTPKYSSTTPQIILRVCLKQLSMAKPLM